MQAGKDGDDASLKVMRALAAGRRPMHLLEVAFTGSGSEYFRIWIVNLLLTLATLGLYYPWAKVRRLRYFYRNTLVDGQPLDFHGDPRRMLRGHLLVALLLVLYSVAGNFSALAGLVAFCAVAAIWPALLKASMQFRLANTSWRGLRLRFTGSTADAYRAMLPLFLPALVILAVTLPGGDTPQAIAPGAAQLAGIATLASVAALPWLWFRLKRYQHAHFAFGQLQSELRTGAGSFYLVALKSLGVTLLVLLAVGGLALLAGGAGWRAWFGGDARQAFGAGLLMALLAILLFVLALRAIVGPYVSAALQNLVWSRTGNSRLRFRSQLRYGPWLALHLKNWLLIVCTLGLYWPFAAVATTRMRLQSVQVVTRVDPSDLFDRASATPGDAAGDAAGDLLGLDIGL